MDLRTPCALCFWRSCSCGREQRAAIEQVCAERDRAHVALNAAECKVVEEAERAERDKAEALALLKSNKQALESAYNIVLEYDEGRAASEAAQFIHADIARIDAVLK
jgi:hypothetical protein